ncbi:vesicle transport V-snare protein, variant [Coemansia spiralis]|nr:vesicle transport V-snare protein, variant [Coemansia spiralis]
MDLFENYESEYAQLVVGIRQRLTTASQLAPADHQAATRAVERDLSEAQELIGQMEMELLALQGAERSKAAPRVRQYKAELDQVRRDSKSMAKSLNEANRRALLGDPAQEEVALESDQRTRLLSGNERLAQGSRRLQESHRLALDTEAVGASILNDLRSQREQIVNTRDTLMQADSHLDRSNRTLRTMTRR